MRRAGIIAAGVVVVAAIVGLAAWFVVFSDTATPVSIEEAVTGFRTDTEPSPAESLPISPGVYVYATSGFEKTDALTGVTHRYPRRSTITVEPAECGMSLTWRVLDGRSTAWTYCVTDDGWMLRSQDERHTFFGRTERTTYVCDDTPIRPRVVSTASWPVTCSTETSQERGSARVVSRDLVRVGGERVAVEHIRKTTTISGDIRGTARHDLWFDSRSGIPVKVVMTTRTTNDSPIGDVNYEEVASLRLTSLEPRR